MKKALQAFWTSFKTKPMRYGATFTMVVLSLYIFFGDINIKISHGDTKAEIKTGKK